MALPSSVSMDAAIRAAQLKSSANDDPITEEEAEKLRGAFKDEEFRKLFSEYVDEISDPKHRQEQEQYISQLEGEGRAPEGKQLVRPSECFVLKFHKTRAATPTEQEKVFINVVAVPMQPLP